MARSLLEFHAYLHYVAAQLKDISVASSLKTPEERGQEFFRILLRARFGTSDPSRKSRLLEAGLREKDVKPFAVKDCRDRLMQDRPDLDWIKGQYDFLCDFVHHNLGSQTTARVGSRLANEWRIGPIRVMLQPESLLNQYVYPSRSAADSAVSQTAGAVLAHVDGAVDALQDTPLSPFSPDELRHFTGSPIGMRQVRGMRAVGRNERCPCGSGKKYKVCHGR